MVIFRCATLRRASRVPAASESANSNPSAARHHVANQAGQEHRGSQQRQQLFPPVLRGMIAMPPFGRTLSSSGGRAKPHGLLWPQPRR